MLMNRKKPVTTALADRDFMKAVGVLADFRKGLRQFLSFSDSILGTLGLTSQQYQALLILLLTRSDGLMIRDLAREMLLLPHGAVQLVNRLEEAGLAERRDDPDDGRVSRVYPTAKAVQTMKILVSAHSRELRQQEKLLSQSLKSLRRLIDTELQS
jgi:DNA-binding MarR family transcriptional regulator